MGDMNGLPQELIEKIVSNTRPGDVSGSLSLVSRNFRSAAISDNVWTTYLPADLISGRALHSQLPNPNFDDPWNKIDSNTLQAFPTKKDLYLFLSDNPLIIDDGAMCFWLDKLSGVRCFHIFPKTLSISEPDQLVKISHDRRFLHALELFLMEHLEIYGTINTCLLSPNNTVYTAYLLIKYSNSYFGGFDDQEDQLLPLETYVGIEGGGCESECSRIVYIPDMPLMYDLVDGEWKSDMPVLTGPQYPQQRGFNTGWYQIELGDYNSNQGGGENRKLKMMLSEVKSGNQKNGISILGIEIRPKTCKSMVD